MPVILMNPPQAVSTMQQPNNFKTFYNWNSSADYNYNIEVEAKNAGGNKNVILEEAGENAEEESGVNDNNSGPISQRADSQSKQILYAADTGKPRLKEVTNPNIAKLLQKKHQMEDTGGDYIYEEEKGTPGSKGHYKKEQAKCGSKQLGKQTALALAEDHFEFENSNTHTIGKSQLQNSSSYNAYTDISQPQQFPHIARNPNQHGESYHSISPPIPPKPPNPGHVKEKSMVCFDY